MFTEIFGTNVLKIENIAKLTNSEIKKTESQEMPPPLKQQISVQNMIRRNSSYHARSEKSSKKGSGSRNRTPLLAAQNVQ